MKTGVIVAISFAGLLVAAMAVAFGMWLGSDVSPEVAAWREDRAAERREASAVREYNYIGLSSGIVVGREGPATHPKLWTQPTRTELARYRSLGYEISGR